MPKREFTAEQLKLYVQQAESLAAVLKPKEREELSRIAEFPKERRQLLLEKLITNPDSARLEEYSDTYKIIYSILCFASSDEANDEDKLLAGILKTELNPKKTTLSDLPAELFKEEIYKDLPIKSIVAHTSTSKISHATLFATSPSANNDAKRLLMHAQAGNPTKVQEWLSEIKKKLKAKGKTDDEIKQVIGEIILAKVPGIEMVEGEETFRSIVIRDWKSVSPLEFVVWAGDLGILEILRKELPANLKEVELDQIKELVQNGHPEHGEILNPLNDLILKLDQARNQNIPSNLVYNYLERVRVSQTKLPIIGLQWLLNKDIYRGTDHTINPKTLPPRRLKSGGFLGSETVYFARARILINDNYMIGAYDDRSSPSSMEIRYFGTHSDRRPLAKNICIHLAEVKVYTDGYIAHYLEKLEAAVQAEKKQSPQMKT